MNIKKKLIPVLIAPLLVGLAFSGQAFANDSDELEKLRQLVQELDQKIKVLDRKGELAEEAAAAKKKETPIVKAGTGGFSFASADGKNEIKFRGIIQADHREFLDGAGDVRARTNNRAGDQNAEGFHDADSTSLLRRIRPTIEGKINDKYAFRFTPEFAGGSASAVDAYVDANLNPAFNIRAGKFKSFVGLERLQGAGDIKFLERSYVTNAILPNRDLGVAVYGSVLDKKLDYAFGIVNGVSDGGNISTGAEYNGEREYTGRLFASPFKDDISPLNGLSFGIAATYTDFTGAKNLNFADTSAADATRNGLPSYVTGGQNTFFRYNSGIIADGQRVRWTPQASYYLGPLGIITEYSQVSQEVSKASGGSDSGGGGSTNTSILAGSNKKLEHNAWNLGVSYLLTGEDASFKGVKPKTDFDIDKGGWGAWELVARYSGLNLDENTFKNKAGEYATDGSTEILAYADLTKSAKSAQIWTAGANWYFNQNAKFAINYAHTSFEGGAIVGGGTGNPTTVADTRNVKDRPDEKAILARFQVTF